MRKAVQAATRRIKNNSSNNNNYAKPEDPPSSGQQQQQQQSQGSSRRDANRHSTPTIATLDHKVRKATPEEAILTAKNYRLAKELSELRVRHREESKNVNRLTMENMNLASRCREAIGQASRLKKEVARLKRELSGDSSPQQQQQKTSTLLAPSQSFGSDDTSQRRVNYNSDDLISPVTSPMPFSPNKTTTIPPLMAPIPTDDQSDTILSPNNLDNPNESSSYNINLSHKTTDAPFAPLRKPSMDQEEQSTQQNNLQGGKAADLAKELGKMDQRLKSQMEENKNTMDTFASTPVDVDEIEDALLLSPSQPEEDISDAFFPTSASPRIGGNYNEGFPDDMLSVDRRSARKRIEPLQGFSELDDDDSALGSSALKAAFGEDIAPSNNKGSIDAFEASFRTSFPESFSPTAKRSVAATSNATEMPSPPDIKSQSATDLYNPFMSSPQTAAKAIVPSMDLVAFRNQTSPGSSPVSKPPSSFVESHKQKDKDDSRKSTDLTTEPKKESVTPERSNVKAKVATGFESKSAAVLSMNDDSHRKDPPGRNRTSTRNKSSTSDSTKTSMAGAFSPALHSPTNTDNRPTVYLSTAGVAASKAAADSHNRKLPSRSNSSTVLGNTGVSSIRNQPGHTRSPTTLADSLVVTRNSNRPANSVSSRSISAPRSYAHSYSPSKSSMGRRNSVDRAHTPKAIDDSHSDSLGYDSARARFERAVKSRRTESDDAGSSEEIRSRPLSHRSFSSPGERAESVSRRRSRESQSLGMRKSSYGSSSSSGEDKSDGPHPSGRFSDMKRGSKKSCVSRSKRSTEPGSYRSPEKLSPSNIEKSVSRYDMSLKESQYSQRGSTREPIDRTYKLNSPSIAPRRETAFEEKKMESDNESVLSVKDRVTLFSIGTDSLPKSPEHEQRRMSALTSPGRNKARVGVANGRAGSALVDSGDIPLVSNLRKVSPPPPTSNVALKARLWGDEELVD